MTRVRSKVTRQEHPRGERMAEKQPGITKKMTFSGEEFEVPFAKGNPGKSR